MVPYTVFTSGGPPGASERSSAKTRHCRIKVTVTGLTCLFYFVRMIFLAYVSLAELKTAELIFGSNAETIQQKDCGQKLNFLSSKHLIYFSDRTSAWMFILFTLGRSLLPIISVFVVFLALNTLVKLVRQSQIVQSLMQDC